MKRLLTIDETDFGKPSRRQTGQYWRRLAVRAVVLDDEDRVYLMHLAKHDTYKLPGGGVDDGESFEMALARELMEEVGIKAEIITEIGKIVEYRDGPMMEQVSLCYLARQVGDKGQTSLEAGEIAEGMHDVLADDIDQAIKLVTDSLPSDGRGSFMHLREQTILRTAKQLIDQS